MKYLRLNICAVFLCCLYSCGERHGQAETDTSEIGTQSGKLPNGAAGTFNAIINCVVDEAFIEAKAQLAEPLTEEQLNTFGLNGIEEIDRSAGLPVKLLDTLWQGNGEKLVLVLLEGPGESHGYLVKFDTAQRLSQFEEVYYADLVEYLMTTTTQIKNNQVTTTTVINDTGEKREKRFVFKEARLFPQP